MPKATVQAAIGAVALDHAVAHHADEQTIEYGTQVRFNFQTLLSDSIVRIYSSGFNNCGVVDSSDCANRGGCDWFNGTKFFEKDRNT